MGGGEEEGNEADFFRGNPAKNTSAPVFSWAESEKRREMLPVGGSLFPM